MQKITNELIDQLIELFQKQSIPMTSVKNVRTLDGYTGDNGRKVIPGKFIRSGSLHSINEEDQKLLQNMGINYIVDLRMKDNCLSKPDKEIPGITYVNCELHSLPSNPAREQKSAEFFRCKDEAQRAALATEIVKNADMAQPYIENLSDPECLKHIAAIFDILLSPDCQGILMHCSEGKDRTGVVSALILSALGVSNEDIQMDYFASVVPYLRFSEDVVYDMKQIGASTDDISKYRGLASVDFKIIQQVMTELRQTYSTAEEFLIRTGILTEEKIGQLRNKYLQ